MDLIDGFAAQLFEDMVDMNKSYRRVFLGTTNEEVKRAEKEKGDCDENRTDAK